MADAFKHASGMAQSHDLGTKRDGGGPSMEAFLKSMGAEAGKPKGPPPFTELYSPRERRQIYKEKVAQWNISEVLPMRMADAARRHVSLDGHFSKVSALHFLRLS